MTYVSNVRHIALLKKSKQSLQDAYDAAEQLIPIDMIQIDVRMAWEQLSEILGEAVGDSLIDQIFHSFAWVNKLQGLLYIVGTAQQFQGYPRWMPLIMYITQ